MPRSMPGWGWDDPFGALDKLGSSWSAGGLGIAGVEASATPYKTLFTALQKRLVGREVSTRVGGHDIALTLTEFDSPLDPLGLTVGQFGQVRLAARDLSWDGHRFDHASAVLHNVHFRPGIPPTLVAAPIDVSLSLPAAVIDEVLQRVAPRVSGEPCADDTVRMHWRRRPAWGGLDIAVELVGSTLWLKARSVTTGSRRWALPARIPAYPVRLPKLPRGLLVTGASLRADSLQVIGLLPQWQLELPMKDLEDAISRLAQKTGAFNFMWPSSPSGFW